MMVVAVMRNDDDDIAFYIIGCSSCVKVIDKYFSNIL